VTLIRPNAGEMPREASVGFGLLGRLIAQAMAEGAARVHTGEEKALLELAREGQET